MKIEKIPFYLEDLSNCLDGTKVNKLVDYKMNQLGYKKATDKADEEGITRQSFAQRLQDHPEKYKVVPFGGFKYVKEKVK